MIDSDSVGITWRGVMEDMGKGNQRGYTRKKLDYSTTAFKKVGLIIKSEFEQVHFW